MLCNQLVPEACVDRTFDLKYANSHIKNLPLSYFIDFMTDFIGALKLFHAPRCTIFKIDVKYLCYGNVHIYCTSDGTDDGQLFFAEWLTDERR